MQKIIYQNILGERAVFLHEGHLLNGSVAGLSATASDFSTVRGAFQQGETLTDARRGYRPLSFTITIMGDSRKDMYQRRMELCRILSMERAVSDTARGRIIYKNDSGEWWTHAVPDDGVPDGKRVRDCLTGIKLKFRCESPFWFGMAQDEVAFIPSGKGFSFPLSFPISFGRRDFGVDVVNRGHVSAPVEVIIQGQGEAPDLYNQRTGQAIRLTAPIQDGSTLYINTDPADLQAKIVDSAGKEESAFGLLAVDTPLAAFMLAPGMNRLSYRPGLASAKSDIRIRWHTRYEGV